MENEQVLMTVMEERLVEDNQGVYRDETIKLLEKEASLLKSRLDKGLPPEEFKEVTAKYQAVVTAGKVIEQAWKSLHASV